VGTKSILRSVKPLASEFWGLTKAARRGAETNSIKLHGAGERGGEREREVRLTAQSNHLIQTTLYGPLIETRILSALLEPLDALYMVGVEPLLQWAVTRRFGGGLRCDGKNGSVGGGGMQNASGQCTFVFRDAGKLGGGTEVTDKDLVGWGTLGGE
jgi:hypothetical protein